MMSHSIADWFKHKIGGLVQERRNSIANALELCLSCTNPSKLGNGLLPNGAESLAGPMKTYPIWDT